jgi:hypothetical protein
MLMLRNRIIAAFAKRVAAAEAEKSEPQAAQQSKSFDGLISVM